jgi:hypothetical protein
MSNNVTMEERYNIVSDTKGIYHRLLFYVSDSPRNSNYVLRRGPFYYSHTELDTTVYVLTAESVVIPIHKVARDLRTLAIARRCVNRWRRRTAVTRMRPWILHWAWRPDGPLGRRMHSRIWT